MKDEAIYNLPVQDLSAKDCVLFLWATYPKLPEAIKTLQCWGFRYSSVAFTWIKTTKNDKWHFGLGYWTRANPEICLIATKGHPKRINKTIPNLIVSRVREHSRKPDEVREKICALLGDLPRIELFARESVKGWDCWGNEVKSDIELKVPEVVK